MYARPVDEIYGLPAFAWRLSAPVIAAGVFMASYISWRPADMLFTLSDALFLAGAGLILIARRMPLRPLGPLTTPWLLLTALMLIGLFIGSAAHAVADRWLIVAMQYAFSLVLLPALLLSQDTRRSTLFFKALLAGVFCMELFGIVLYFGYDGTYEEFRRFGPDFVTGGRRLGAFLGDANWNAAAITLALPFALFLRLRRQISSVVFSLLMGVFLMALVLTASVGGIISGTFSLIIFGITARVKPSARSLVIICTVIGIASVSGYGMPKAFSERVTPALESGDVDKAGTFVGRMDLIREAWGIVEDTTVVGIGVDQFREISVEAAPVHNIFLLLWAEGGLMALVAWFLLMLIVAATAWLASYRDRLGSALAFSVLGTFMVFSNANPHMYARFWVVPLLLALVPALQAVSDQPPLSRSTRRGREAPPAQPFERVKAL
jgi:O-antigen ligase